MMIIMEFIILQIKIFYYCLEAFIKLFISKVKQPVNNKVVLITGTGHGIGKELAIQYAKLGARVLCVDINEKTNNETIKEIKTLGGTAFAYTCNITQRNAVQELALQLKKEHTFIDIIVNNAGIMPTHSLLQQNEAEIKLTYDVNVFAHFWILQAFLPDMLKRNQGHIVALSSVAGFLGAANLIPYCGSKFAVQGIMFALDEELRSINPENNIKLTTVYPYMVDTGLCRKPHYRFNWLRLVRVEYAAAAIIQAQRAGLKERCIPDYFTFFKKMNAVLPRKVSQLLLDYCDVGVYSDL